MRQQYRIMCSGNAPALYPCYMIWGLLWYAEDEALELPKRYPFSGEWGAILSNVMPLRTSYPLPLILNLLWISLTERKMYVAELPLSLEQMEVAMQRIDPVTGEQLYTHFVVGMAPYGRVACWLSGQRGSEILFWENAEEIENHQEVLESVSINSSLDEQCDYYINNDERVRENLEMNGLPPRHLFDKYMQQFCYRYLMLFEHWDDDEERWVKLEKNSEGDEKPQPELDFVEEALYDGTHDKLHDGSLMNYHKGGKPKKLTLQWHVKKSEYTAYLWLDDESICTAFERFYGAHPDTKADFIVRIDVEKKKFELALYRYGLKEPVVISEDAYQMIVFKNKFEYYHSENYDQPRGAWIW